MVTSRTAALAAVLALAGLLAASPAAEADVEDLGAFPNPFSPNGDGVYDAVEITYYLTEADSVEVDLADSLGTVVRNLNAGDWAQDAGAHSYTWYGLNDESQQQPDGRYTLTVETHEGDTSELIIVLDRTAPSVGQLLVSPSRFTPDADGVADSTFIEFELEQSSPSDRFWVKVVDPDEESEYELLTGTGAESVGVYWNGVDPEGVAAPDTVYFVRVTVVDAAGNEDDAQTLVDLDLKAPLLTVAYAPDADSSVVRVAASAETTVVGSAYDRAGVDYVLLSVDGGETWSSPESTRRSREETYLQWSAYFACETCTLGVRDDTTSVMVRGHDATLTSDGLGHYNTDGSQNPVAAFDVVFDVAPPLHDSSETVDEDATYESGEMIIIDSYWDSPGYTVEADFSFVDSAVDSMFDMSDVSVDDKGTGRYRIQYTTSAGNSVAPVYATPVRIRAVDRFGRSDTTAVAVTVLEGSGGVPGLAVDVNSFDPFAAEEVTIALGAGGSGGEVDIYNMAGTLVRTLEAGGDAEVSWDGRNGSGDLVASGVYFLHIRTSAGDATRAVAVVK